MRHWRLWLLVAALPVMFGAWCDPIEYNDGGVVTDGGTVADGGSTVRDITFNGLTAGEFDGGSIDGATLTVGDWQGSTTAQVVNFFGEGQDLQLACAMLTVQTPEGHASFSLIFNDDQGPLYVNIYDTSGQSFLDAAIDTQADAQTVGITTVDAAYKKLTAQAASGSRLIGALVVASCTGYVHEIVLQ